MIITGKDVRHPVLLYLHGGMPDYFLTRKYPTGLEASFTVVWWEQRGSGMSYRADTPPVTVEHLISDTLEVTKDARQRFGKDKIYLMGHSGGTFIGIQAAARAPQLYHASIGVAPISHQLQSEKLAYDDMLQQFRANGNARMVQNLEAAPVTLTDGTPDAYRAVRDEAMHRLGIGTTHDMQSILTGIVVPSWQSRDYTVGEKVNTWRAKAAAGVSSVWDTALATDRTQQVPQLDIPVYFFSGRYDYTVNSSLAKNYFERIEAPTKGFYTFEQSAHSPLFEEPDKVRKIVQEDILVGGNSRADAK
jgi:pimeloyl-ACP methyl ester carboxylesterase